MRALSIAIALAVLVPGTSVVAQDNAYSFESRAAIGAHHLCSGLWVVGRVTKRTAAEILAQDIAPFADFSWDPSFAYDVDAAKQSVTVRGKAVPPRTAVYNGDQGCTILPSGDSGIHFKPIPVPRNLPDAATQPWPMGDAGATVATPAGVAGALDWGHGAERAQHPRDRGRACGKNRRRTLRAGLDEGHAADQLVGRQEHHVGAGWHHRPPRRSRR